MMTPDSMMNRMMRSAVQLRTEAQVSEVRIADLAAQMALSEETVREMFPDDAALNDTVATFIVMLLSDTINKAMVAVPADDERAVLIALGTAYVTWAYRNPVLFRSIAFQTHAQGNAALIVQRYDASFLPLVRRFLGEQADSVSSRALIVRSFVFGLASIALDKRLSLWLGKENVTEDDLRDTVTDFMEMLVACPPLPGSATRAALAQHADDDKGTAVSREGADAPGGPGR